MKRSFNFIFLFTTIMVHAQDANKKPKDYLKFTSHGVKFKSHKSVNKKEYERQFAAHQDFWLKAFHFLQKTDLSQLAPGTYPIDGENVFATVTSAPGKLFENSSWESHKKYVDLQLVIDGAETIGVAPVASATLTKPYSETKDVMNYNAEGVFHEAVPGTYFLFFPTDAHRPGIKVNEGNIHKLVIKIKAAE